MLAGFERSPNLPCSGFQRPSGAALTCASAAAQAAKSKSPASEAYVAHLHAMNSKVTGLRTTGEARFTVRGDVLTITVNLRGVPLGIVHWQHLHGFKDGRDANCPTGAADTNHDGVIDVAETEPVSGTTMVPFDKHSMALRGSSMIAYVER